VFCYELRHSVLRGNDAASLGKRSPTFRRNILSYIQGSGVPRRFIFTWSETREKSLLLWGFEEMEFSFHRTQ
jgi:hypothetical protein